MDKIQIYIKHPEVFISKRTLKKLSFTKESDRWIQKSMPALAQTQITERIQGAVKTANVLVTTLSSGNFLIWFGLGGSLQVLWELIRSMRFIVLSLLIKVPLPGHSQEFFDGCAAIAQLDVFDGKDLYRSWFDMNEAPPLNERFEMMDISGKNFLLNSGSIFIFLGGIFAYNLILFILEIIATFGA